MEEYKPKDETPVLEEELKSKLVLHRSPQYNRSLFVVHKLVKKVLLRKTNNYILNMFFPLDEI